MSETKPRKQKHKDPKPQPTPSGAERLKTVVRRLPPNLPEAVFWQSVQTWVTDDTVAWKSYFPGKFRTKRANKEGIPSRAYIAFKNQDLVARFSREYDGHVFRDKAGNESQAIVEFAPFEKIPTDKRKSDARQNTIDRDEDYISFLKSLEGETEPVPLDTVVTPPPPTTTPLLEALKADKLAQKDKETILRSHAHYKESKREEGKKKAAPVPAKVETAAPSLSKKARKAAAAAASTVAPAPPSAPSLPEGKQPKAPSTPASPRPKEHQAQTPTPTSTPTPAPEDTPSQRKRPVVGLGRHFEAALNGAGVERPKQDDKGKRREGVPSILQRPEERAVSPKEPSGGVPSAGAARGSRRGRGRGRGRGT